MFRKSGHAVAWGAVVLIAADVIVAPARPALANGFCQGVTPPMVDALILCDPGSEAIPVPPEVQVVQVAAIGGGGGGGMAGTPPADGGSGVGVAGWVTLPPGTMSLQLTIGAGGQGRYYDSATHNYFGARGGGGTGVYALRGNLLPVPLIVAGGGGGGGGTNRANATQFGSGGDAGVQATTMGPAVLSQPGADAGDPADLLAFGGLGADLAQPGDGGMVQPSAALTIEGVGSAGAAPSPTDEAPVAGGAGAVNGGGGGGGGGGYSGGGGGAAQLYDNGVFDEIMAGGGGGGASYINSDLAGVTLSTGAQSSNSINGAGGSGLTAAAGGPGQLLVVLLSPPVITSVSPAGGRLTGGETITITGSGLDGGAGVPGLASPAPEVTVGGSACLNETVVSATELTCEVPAAVAGTQDVKVTASNGTDTEVGGYKYVDVPQIASLSPVKGSLAGGTTLTVSGTHLDTTTSVKVDGVACPGTGAHDAYVATPTSVTCTVPAAANGPGAKAVEVTTLGGSDTEPFGFRYSGPQAIASVLPTAGPQAGGNSMTILGESLGGVGMVVVGNGQCASVAPTDSIVTCVVPSAASPGKVDVMVSSSAGVTTKSNAYEYLPAPTVPPNRPPVIVDPPATSPTPAPTTSPPVTPPAEAPKLNLVLDLKPGAPVSGAGARISGGGLRGNSQYTVTMYSSPVRLASGYADETGSFTARFKVPQRACVKGGLHRVVLSGFAPDGTVVSTTNWLLFDDSCTTRALPSPAKPAVVTYGTFHFDYASAKLTPYVKAVLKRTRSTLTSAKRVTITGYTQTTSKGEGAKPANRALGLRRAKAIRAYLRALGLKTPITVIGAGAVDPLKGRPQRFNRRAYVTARY
jgi:outer membrane protein OmpA-like peptidoglycan-associated protein